MKGVTRWRPSTMSSPTSPLSAPAQARPVALGWGFFDSPASSSYVRCQLLLLCRLSFPGGSSAILIFDVLGVWECLRALPGPLTLCGLAAPLLFLLFRPLGVCASPAMRYKRPSAEPNKQDWAQPPRDPHTKHYKAHEMGILGIAKEKAPPAPT